MGDGAAGPLSLPTHAITKILTFRGPPFRGCGGLAAEFLGPWPWPWAGDRFEYRHLVATFKRPDVPAMGKPITPRPRKATFSHVYNPGVLPVPGTGRDRLGGGGRGGRFGVRNPALPEIGRRTINPAP